MATVVQKVRFVEPQLQIDTLPLTELLKVQDYVQSLIPEKSTQPPLTDHTTTANTVEMDTDFIEPKKTNKRKQTPRRTRHHLPEPVPNTPTCLQNKMTRMPKTSHHKKDLHYKSNLKVWQCKSAILRKNTPNFRPREKQVDNCQQ